MSLIDINHLLGTAMLFDRADFDARNYVQHNVPRADYDLGEKIEDWQRDGVVIFENAVPHDLIDALLNDIDYLCQHTRKFDLEIEHGTGRHNLRDIDFNPLSDQGTKFNCIENISLAARKLSLNHFICDFLSHVFQDMPCVLQSLTFWKGSNQPAHTDYPYVRTQTKLSQLAASWIPLEDVHADAGPLVYYPGSHKPGLVKPFDWGAGSVVLERDSTRHVGELAPYLHDQMKQAGLSPKVFLPKKGDVLIWHGWVVHEGMQTHNPDLTRKSYVSHYTGLEAYPPSHMMPNAIKKKHYTHLNGGYVFDHPWVKDRRKLPSWR